MTGYLGFGVLLARLSDHRKLDIGALSRLAGIPDPKLRAVFDGVAPSTPLLRQLAPALNLHAADLFVLAGAAVPDEMAPLDAKARGSVPHLARDAMRLTPEQRHRLRRLVLALPQENRTQPVQTQRVYEQYEQGFGAVLVRMLSNRNLDWMGTARTFVHLTGRYWSASTYGMVGHGRKELTPDLLADFATVLSIPADDLAVLAGIDLPDGTPPQNPAAADVAKLIWDVRRLTAAQVQQVIDAAESIRQKS
jgi:hypothetical protein